MNNPPTEILHRIMRNVDRPSLRQLSQVNREWYSVASPMLWETVTEPAHLGQGSFYSSFMYALLPRSTLSPGRYIQSINMDQFQITDQQLLLTMKYTPNVMTAVFKNASLLTDESLTYTDLYWEKLTTLYLAGSPISQATYKVLGEDCKYLKQLELINCKNLLPNSLEYFANSSTLETLILDIYDSASTCNKGDIWQYYPLQVPSLRAIKHIQVHGLPYGIFGQLPTPGAMFLNLSTLYLDQCLNVTDRHLIPWLYACPHLVNICVTDSKFTNKSLQVISYHQRCLRTLDISFNDCITALAVRRLVQQQPLLTLVTLSYCNIRMAQFPEATPDCAGQVKVDGITVTRLDHLNHTAINMIRQAP